MGSIHSSSMQHALQPSSTSGRRLRRCCHRCVHPGNCLDSAEFRLMCCASPSSQRADKRMLKLAAHQLPELPGCPPITSTMCDSDEPCDACTGGAAPGLPRVQGLWAHDDSKVAHGGVSARPSCYSSAQGTSVTYLNLELRFFGHACTWQRRPTSSLTSSSAVQYNEYWNQGKHVTLGYWGAARC